PGAFDHRQARGLHRREAATAVAALSPPADRGAVFAGPRVDDPRVGLTTERTTHLYSSNLMSTARPWAGSCSLAARASMCSATSARAPRSSSMTWRTLLNECPPRPEPWAAVPMVGSTWFDPAQ